MSRNPTRRLALTAALLLTPALASSQTAATEFGSGTLYTNGPFSANGCGTYLCLDLTAGAGGRGIRVTVTRATTAAFDAIGAKYYFFTLHDRVDFCAY